jgi:hypothetical protein
MKTLPVCSFMEAQRVSRRLLQVWPASIQVESLRQDIERIAYDLLRVLPKLPIEVGIVVCVDATFEGSGVNGSIKEPRRDTQCANLIASVPFGADLVALAIHVACPITSNAPNCALARLDEKYEG